MLEKYDSFEIELEHSLAPWHGKSQIRPRMNEFRPKQYSHKDFHLFLLVCVFYCPRKTLELFFRDFFSRNTENNKAIKIF